MSLETLNPKQVTFDLIAEGKHLQITLRPFRVIDHHFLIKTIPDDVERARAVENLDLVPLLPVLWHQMDFESKKLFDEFDVRDVDDSGNEFEVKGADKIGYLIDRNQSIKALFALIECMGISMPELDQLKEAHKKKRLIKKK